MRRAALVTGANRGVGFEICRQLCKAGLAVVLTARDPERGEKACRRLTAEGLDARFHTLDVADPESARKAVAFAAAELGRLDVLVNNAAIALDHKLSVLDVDPGVVQRTFDTNFFGALRLCQAAIPLMQRNGYGRIVNVTSARGSFAKLGKGGPSYRMSKTLLNALTVILADELKDTNVLVNAVTPGWVRTRLGFIRAVRSTVEGAEGAVWLATLPDDGPRGKFFKDRQELPW